MNSNLHSYLTSPKEDYRNFVKWALKQENSHLYNIKEHYAGLSKSRPLKESPPSPYSYYWNVHLERQKLTSERDFHARVLYVINCRGAFSENTFIWDKAYFFDSSFESIRNIKAESVFISGSKINTIENLDCKVLSIDSSRINSIRNLPNCEVLICKNSRLETLENIPQCRFLRCPQNKLKELPELPLCERLVCDYNQLKALPELPTVQYLYCEFNKLRKLPDLPMCKALGCRGNKIKPLPKLNNTPPISVVEYLGILNRRNH